MNQVTARRAGPLGVVTPNTRAHWGMLVGGAVGGVIFNAISLADSATRHGYDWVSQPLGALSLGPGGTAQVVNFLLLGAGTCVSSFGWRPTLAGGPGAIWYPRLSVVSGVALIVAGLVSARYNVAAYIGLAVMIAGLALLGYRLRSSPRWRGWGAGALVTGALMAICLVLVGILAGGSGPAGVFERLAWLTPTVFGIALVVRFLTARDARVGAVGAR